MQKAGCHCTACPANGSSIHPLSCAGQACCSEQPYQPGPLQPCALCRWRRWACLPRSGAPTACRRCRAWTFSEGRCPMSGSCWTGRCERGPVLGARPLMLRVLALAGGQVPDERQLWAVGCGVGGRFKGACRGRKTRSTPRTAYAAPPRALLLTTLWHCFPASPGAACRGPRGAAVGCVAGQARHPGPPAHRVCGWAG